MKWAITEACERSTRASRLFVNLLDTGVVDCAYDHQKENQAKADEVEECCLQQADAEKENGHEESNSQEELVQEESNS